MAEKDRGKSESKPEKGNILTELRDAIDGIREELKGCRHILTLDKYASKYVAVLELIDHYRNESKAKNRKVMIKKLETEKIRLLKKIAFSP